MRTDTTPTRAHTPISLRRRKLRDQLVVNGIVAAVSVIVATIGYAIAKTMLESSRWKDTPVEIDDKTYKLGDLPEFVSANGSTPTIATIGFVATMALAIAALVQGCIGAAEARTYLGAGLSRRDFHRMHVRAGITNTAIVAAFAAAAVLLQAIVVGDLSGRLIFKSGQTGNAWLVFLSAIALAMLAYWGGFAISSLFVRFPWYVPTAGILLYSALSGVVDWLLGVEFFHELNDSSYLLPTPALLAEILRSAAWAVVAVIGSWFAVRRMPIRR